LNLISVCGASITAVKRCIFGSNKNKNDTYISILFKQAMFCFLNILTNHYIFFFISNNILLYLYVDSYVRTQLELLILYYLISFIIIIVKIFI